MSRKNKLTGKTLGVALMVIGAGLAVWGYQLSGSLTSEVSQTFTGTYTDKVMMLYIGAAASVVVGLYLFSRR